MRLDDFQALVRRLAGEVPAEFFDGILEVTVSPRTLPHPTRAEIYTLGECIPVPAETGGPDAIQSRIVLYHGSFVALSHLAPEFDWREEAWETLTHELRHHVEWRASVPDLEALDLAMEQNFARLDGERFDPMFHHDGEAVAPGVYRIEDDYFVEQVVRDIPRAVRLPWHGQEWRIGIPDGLTLPAFLTVEGVTDPPPGDLVLVLRSRPGLRTLLRWRRGSDIFQAVVQAEPWPRAGG